MKFIHLDVDEIIPIPTSHAVGLKKILAQGSNQANLQNPTSDLGHSSKQRRPTHRPSTA